MMWAHEGVGAGIKYQGEHSKLTSYEQARGH